MSAKWKLRLIVENDRLTRSLQCALAYLAIKSLFVGRSRYFGFSTDLGCIEGLLQQLDQPVDRRSTIGQLRPLLAGDDTKNPFLVDTAGKRLANFRLLLSRQRRAADDVKMKRDPCVDLV